MKKIQLMTRVEAADYAGVARQTIYRWIKNGKLPLYCATFRSKRIRSKGWVSTLDIDNLK